MKDNMLFQPSSLHEAIEAVRHHQLGLEAANDAYSSALAKYAASLSPGSGQSAVQGLLGRMPPVYELLICLDGSARLEIDRNYGDSKSASFTQKMLNFAICSPLRGAKLVHNHPSQGSLSDSDWKILFSYPNVKEIIAVNSSGSVFSGSITTSMSASGAPIELNQAQDNSATVTQAINSKIISCSLANVTMQMLTDVKPLISHLVNERYNAKGIIVYSPALSNGDNAILADGTLTPIFNAINSEIVSLMP